MERVSRGGTVGIVLALSLALLGCTSQPASRRTPTLSPTVEARTFVVGILGDRVDRVQVGSLEQTGEPKTTQLTLAVLPGGWSERDTYRLLAWLHGHSSSPRLQLSLTLINADGTAILYLYQWMPSEAQLLRLRSSLPSPYPNGVLDLAYDARLDDATPALVQGVADGGRPLPTYRPWTGTE